MMSAHYDLSRMHFGSAPVRLQSQETPVAAGPDSLTMRVDKNTDLDEYPNENGTTEKTDMQKVLGSNDIVDQIANQKRNNLNRKVAPAVTDTMEDERKTKPVAIGGTGIEIDYGRLSMQEIISPFIAAVEDGERVYRIRTIGVRSRYLA